MRSSSSNRNKSPSHSLRTDPRIRAVGSGWDGLQLQSEQARGRYHNTKQMKLFGIVLYKLRKHSEAYKAL